MMKKESSEFEAIYQGPFIKEHVRIVYDANDKANWKYLSDPDELEKFLGFKKYNLKYQHYFYDVILKRAEESMISIQGYLEMN